MFLLRDILTLYIVPGISILVIESFKLSYYNEYKSYLRQRAGDNNENVSRNLSISIAWNQKKSSLSIESLP